jgi:hypothetical protein
MKHRTAFLLVLAGAAGVAGCFEDTYDGYGRYDDSSIVFGIDQTKGADGNVITSVGYEMLDVRNKGWSARGFVAADRSCWAERLDDRLGQPHVEGGFAKFQGGLLPPEGVAVVANRADDLTLPGPAWTHAGEKLTFEAHGFAMPDIEPSPLVVPSLDLTIVSPADAAADVAVPVDQELEVAWTPSDKAAQRENVVASLTAVAEGQPGSRGVELRCFFDRTAGTGRFPKNLTTRFATLLGAAPGSAIKGKLHIATHRQLTIFARGGWTVYVVASAEQREQPFTLQR